MNIRTYEKWTAILDRSAPHLSENEIIYLRKAINGDGTLGAKLLQHFRASPKTFLVTPEQSAKGLEWLKRVNFKLNGELRKGAFINEFEAHKLKHCLENFSHFVLDDLQDTSVKYGGRTNYTPVYTLHATDGAEFTYHVSGMGEVVIYTFAKAA